LPARAHVSRFTQAASVRTNCRVFVELPAANRYLAPPIATTDSMTASTSARAATQGAPTLSRRAGSLGTENAFVVLAEVNQLLRAGRDVISFCIGQPDFPTPVHIQDAAVGGDCDSRRAARLHPVGRH